MMHAQCFVHRATDFERRLRAWRNGLCGILITEQPFSTSTTLLTGRCYNFARPTNVRQVYIMQRYTIETIYTRLHG